VKLTVLGCSGTFPGPDSPCSSYLVEADGFRLLLDMGNGALGALQRAAGLLELDAVLVSHVHGDHCLDLVPYAYARRYHPSGRPRPLPVYGPAGLQDRLCDAFDSAPREALTDVYDFHVTEPGRLEVGPFSVTLGQVNHPVECHGVRLEHAGRSLAYSADTAGCRELVDLARGVDLFLCEASYLDGDSHPPGVHLTGGEAGEHAARADVGQLLLTHLVPWGDPVRAVTEAQQAYGGDVLVARSGATYPL